MASSSPEWKGVRGDTLEEKLASVRGRTDIWPLYNNRNEEKLKALLSRSESKIVTTSAGKTFVTVTIPAATDAEKAEEAQQDEEMWIKHFSPSYLRPIPIGVLKKFLASILLNNVEEEEEEEDSDDMPDLVHARPRTCDKPFLSEVVEITREMKVQMLVAAMMVLHNANKRREQAVATLNAMFLERNAKKKENSGKQ